MSSLYHATWSTEDTSGAKWCSAFKNALAVDGTAVEAKATNGMSGRAKCTWQYLVADGSMGPTIKLKAASYVKFLFFWTEWLNTDGLTTDGRLP